MTIEQIERRKANKKKNIELIKSGRLNKVSAGLYSLDGVEFYTTSNDSEAMMTNNFEQRLAEHLAQQKRAEQRKADTIEALQTIADKVAKYNCILESQSDSDYIYIKTADGVFVKSIYVMDVLSKDYLKQFDNFYYQVKAANNREQNTAALKQAEQGGIIKRIGWDKLLHIATGEVLRFDEYDLQVDYTQSHFANSLVNSLLKRRSNINENKEVERQAEQHLIKLMTDKGLKIKTSGDAWSIYYKGAKILFLDTYTYKVHTDKSTMYEVLTVLDFEPSRQIKELLQQLENINS